MVLFRRSWIKFDTADVYKHLCSDFECRENRHIESYTLKESLSLTFRVSCLISQMKFGISYLFIMLFCIRELCENRHT